VVAFIAGLSAFLGWLKLRRRDMGLLFEAAGWALNGEMKITRRLAVMFTRSPGFPAGTVVDRFDLLSETAEVKAQDKIRHRRQRRTIYALAILTAVLAIWFGGQWIPWVKSLFGA